MKYKIQIVFVNMLNDCNEASVDELHEEAK